jgi:hypothetical protein
MNHFTGPRTLSEAELDTIMLSLKQAAESGPIASTTVDWISIRNLLAVCAHKPHKDWVVTEESADLLCDLLKDPDDMIFQQTFDRVLTEGHWASAAAAAASQTTHTPWIVLITGLNGIRKTTSIYQTWYSSILKEALDYDGNIDELPIGSNSFFRQLDYMITTIANEEFKALYEITDLLEYSLKKEAIFSKYRTIAEMVGILLIKSARKKCMNIMVETTGRDIAMFRYINHLFPDDIQHGYKKLVVHFTINDLSLAELSVDTRMTREMLAGRAAIASGALVRDIINANAGGPYGSSVLAGVYTESQEVWTSIRAGHSDVGSSWLKASIAIDGSHDNPWTARAVTYDSAGRIQLGIPHEFSSI